MYNILIVLSKPENLLLDTFGYVKLVRWYTLCYVLYSVPGILLIVPTVCVCYGLYGTFIPFDTYAYLVYPVYHTLYDIPAMSLVVVFSLSSALLNSKSNMRLFTKSIHPLTHIIIIGYFLEHTLYDVINMWVEVQVYNVLSFLLLYVNVLEYLCMYGM